MDYYELLKQYVSTGLPLIEYQFDKIKNDGQLTNTYFYNRNKILDRYSLEKYEVNFIETNPKYFSKFDQNDLFYFMSYANNKDEMAKIIIKAKGDQLGMGDISYLLSYSKNRDEIAKMIIKAKGEELNWFDMRSLLKYSANPNEIAKMIIKAKGDELTLEDLIPMMGFINTKIENKKLSSILNDLTDREILKIIYKYYSDKYRLDNAFKFIINNKNPNTWGDEIKHILSDAGNKERIKNLLIQSGVDRSLIPNY